MAFRAICAFVNDLASEFGKKNKALQLYRRLINQTQIVHAQAVRRHITVFKDFCVAKRSFLLSKDNTIFKNVKLKYSENIYIDLDRIHRQSDAESLSIIWKHIWTISAIVDPAGQAKTLLSDNNSAEGDFLQNAISKIEGNIRPDASPMEIFGSIMQSGIATELFGSIQNGQVDPTKLFSTVSGVLKKIEGQVSDDPQAKQAMTAVTGLFGTLENATKGGAPPDLNNVLSTLTGALQGLGGAMQGSGATGGASSSGATGGASSSGATGGASSSGATGGASSSGATGGAGNEVSEVSRVTTNTTDVNISAEQKTDNSNGTLE
jgi:hypothetical protein